VPNSGKKSLKLTPSSPREKFGVFASAAIFSSPSRDGMEHSPGLLEVHRSWPKIEMGRRPHTKQTNKQTNKQTARQIETARSLPLLFLFWAQFLNGGDVFNI